MSMQRLSVLFVALLGMTGSPVAAQEPPAAADKPDPVIAEQIKQFKSAIADRKGTRDDEAGNLVAKFLIGYPTMHAKDQADVRKALQGCLLSGKIKRDPSKSTLFTGCAEALGRMEQEGAKILTKAFKSSKFKGEDWVSLRAVIVRNVGRDEGSQAGGLAVGPRLARPLRSGDEGRGTDPGQL